MKDYFKRRNEQPIAPLVSRIEGAYHQFFAEYIQTSGISHSGSKGTARENPVRDFFASLVPGNLGATSGEIIDIYGNVSPQSDLIIFRVSDAIPILDQAPTILQVESVICVTEVKSKITKEEYKDCLIKAKRLFDLRPFGKEFDKYSRFRTPTSEDCRVFLSIFAYSSDTKSSLKEEYQRFHDAAVDCGVDESLINRIYILGKGVINPSEKKFAHDTPERKIGLFYFYSHLLQFAVREASRRKGVPYLMYFGRMSQGWETI